MTIAIVGMACRYPDARSPYELWENVLAQRRAFRRIPPERLFLEDYLSSDRNTPDAIYSTEAALIEGYEFDRVGFRVVGSTFRSADLVHWLALDMAAQALADAGFPDGEDLPRLMTGVLLGNTLTGEFSRANTLRLRWQYVRRVVERQLKQDGMSASERQRFLEQLEVEYKQPFAEIGEESLAGNLSNTIAGRICNYFDLKGGGYTVDGACSSSLLAVAQACSSLVAGDLDVAIAGGVDISLDPFELVGFAKAGALAEGEMRVYDVGAAGFIPGEGCGMMVLMRYEDAIIQKKRIYALIQGWGISSDGQGGITRPEVEGQLLALQRAYQRAGFGIETVGYFEGHGTGTKVGDATELTVLSNASKTAKAAQKTVISSIKANIGHTKAAAGIAGLIKATMAIDQQILPPMTGCEHPHPDFFNENTPLEVLQKGTLWANKSPLRAGVSAMGFGGINTHVVLESATNERRQTLTPQEHNLIATPQDAELILLATETIEQLQEKVAHLLTFAYRLSRAELADLAAELCLERKAEGESVGGVESGERVGAQGLRPGIVGDRVEKTEAIQHSLNVRAALVVSNPQELTKRLEILQSWLLESEIRSPLPPLKSRGDYSKVKIKHSSGVFLGIGSKNPKIGFLFPGQASPVYLDGGIWKRRFSFLEKLYPLGDSNRDIKSTAIAQPAIITSSVAGLQVLEQFGIKAEIAVGHSLGELSALYWAGGITENALLQLAKVRGKAMAELGHPTGVMASIGSDESAVRGLLNGKVVTIAGLNSPQQTVISGEKDSITEVVAKAKEKGLKAVLLPVSQAFHSPLVAAATHPLSEYLEKIEFKPLQHSVVSTVTGSRLLETENLRSLLIQQITSPVRFMEAISQASQGLDLLMEVGSGEILSGLVKDFINIPVVALDAASNSLQGLLETIGIAFAMGVPINHHALFSDRFTRPFNLDWQPRFFVNPCEGDEGTRRGETRGHGDVERGDAEIGIVGAQGLHPQGLHPRNLRDDRKENKQEKTKILFQNSSFIIQNSKDCVRQLVALRTELPTEAVKDEHRLLSDLHLNSITVAQIVTEASRSLGLSPPVSPTDYADATVGEIAQALEELSNLSQTNQSQEETQVPAGVDAWIRTFKVELVESPLNTSILPLESLASNWQMITTPVYPLKTALEEALKQCQGSGVIVCLPPNRNENYLDLLLKATKIFSSFSQNPIPPTPLTKGGLSKIQNSFILVQHGGGGAAFARTFHLENPKIRTCVIDVPLHHAQAIDWIITEIQVSSDYSEAYYDESGKRRSPLLRLITPQERQMAIPPTYNPPYPPSKGGEREVGRWQKGISESPKVYSPIVLTPADILLVTGGGKGIAAECALSLAKETGVRLVLLGRSKPDTDRELAQNLTRMTALGIVVQYLSVDVTDTKAVQECISEIESTIGTITAILHGAGVNKPKLLKNLNKKDLLTTIAPKVDGLRNLLNAVNPDSLRLLITFGSIIARIGLPGEADYALANEWLSHLVEEFDSQHPHCRCLNIEWSVWSGVGMGERLGRIDALIQQGITPIPPDTGVMLMRRLLSQPLPTTSVVVTGRFGNPPTLKLKQSELSFLRFLEQSKVYYPGVELVVDVELSTQTDPYLEDHIFQGDRIFPGVMGLEAIAQVVSALLETSEIPIFEQVQFNRPIVVPADSPLKIRIAALVQDSGKVDVVLRSEQTGFSVDHFRAVCCHPVGAQGLRPERLNPQHFNPQGLRPQSLNQITLNPQKDLYGELLFHKGRFQRLRNYRHLQATECLAEIALDQVTPWFSRYLPKNLVLGDPGARDAVIHALQACVPQATLLPISIERLVINQLATAETLFVSAKERERLGDIFIYDLEVIDNDGSILEQWQGLKLQIIQPRDTQLPWVASLLAPYLQRRIQEFIPHTDLKIIIDKDGTVERRIRSDRSLQALTSVPLSASLAPLHRRPDGKPELNNGKAVSVAHTGDLTLVVAGTDGCDVEPVVSRPVEVWRDLLGVEKFTLAQLIAQETGESLDISATRLWTAIECLKKAGAMVNLPLVLAETSSDEVVWLQAGESAIATFVVSVREFEQPLVFAVLSHFSKKMTVGWVSLSFNPTKP